jgi:hypothetical protein
LSPSSVDCTCIIIELYPINKMIKLTKKAIELLDAVTSVISFLFQEMFGVYYKAWSGCRLTFHPATPTGSPATLTRVED